MNSQTGQRLWTFNAGSPVTSSPVIGPDGTLYIGAHNRKVYAIKTDSRGPASSPWPMRGQNARRTSLAPTPAVPATPKASIPKTDTLKKKAVPSDL